MFDIIEQQYNESFEIPSCYYDAIRFYLGRFVADFKEEKVDDGGCVVRWLIPDGISESRISRKTMWSEIKCLKDRLFILLEMSECFKKDIRLSNAENEDALIVRITNDILYLPVDNIESATYVTQKENLVITRWLKPPGVSSAGITARQIDVFIQKLYRFYNVIDFGESGYIIPACIETKKKFPYRKIIGIVAIVSLFAMLASVILWSKEIFVFLRNL